MPRKGRNISAPPVVSQSNQSDPPMRSMRSGSRNDLHDRNRAERVGDRRKKRNRKKKPKCYDPVKCLPYDICIKIFSLLRQSQCLRAMMVSKAWLEHVPELSKPVWKTVELLGDSNDQYNTLLLRCIGPHVQKIVLGHFHQEEELFNVMRIVRNHKCTELNWLWFDACGVDNQEQFLKSLKPLVQNVVTLEFTRQVSNVALIPVMWMCPKLRHFSFKTNSYSEPEGIFYEEPYVYPYSELLPCEAITFNITYLCISATMHKESRLTPILKRCPKLRCLRIGGFKQEYEDPPYNFEEVTAAIITGQYSDGLCHRSSTTTDLPLVMALCPKLQYLEFNNGDDDDVEWREYSNETLLMEDVPSHRGLKLLEVYELYDYGPAEIVPFIKQQLDTLEVLRLGLFSENSDSDWSLLGEISSHTLRAFTCKDIDIDALSLAAVIEQCPNLEIIELVGCGDNINTVVLEAIDQLQNLKSLALSYDDEYFIQHPEKALYDLLQKFVWMGTASTLTAFSINVADDVVMDLIGQIRTLKSITIINTLEEVSHGALMKFAKRMRNNDIVMSLGLCFFRLTPAIFERLASMKALLCIDVCWCQMSGQAFQTFVDNAPCLVVVIYSGPDGTPCRFQLFDNYGERKPTTFVCQHDLHHIRQSTFD